MRNPLERKTLRLRLAERVEAEILAGTWVGKLPGKRPLAEMFEVDVKTCAAALDLLEARGVIGKSVQGKRREILAVAEKGQNDRKVEGKCLLALHPNMAAMSFHDEKLLRGIIDVWEEREGGVVSDQVDFSRYKHPGGILERKLSTHSADALVMFMPSGKWSAAAARRLPTFQLGGGYEQVKEISLCAYALDKEVEKVAASFRMQGHKRVMVPVSRAVSRKAISQGLAKGMQLADKQAARLYCPVFAEDVPEVWQGYWQRYFDLLKPTAVVVFEDNHLVSLYSFCMSRGMRIPDDIAVTSLSYTERFEWAVPRPTMLRFPNRLVIRAFREWLAGGMVPFGRKFLPLDWGE